MNYLLREKTGSKFSNQKNDNRIIAIRARKKWVMLQNDKGSCINQNAYDINNEYFNTGIQFMATYISDGKEK